MLTKKSRRYRNQFILFEDHRGERHCLPLGRVQRSVVITIRRLVRDLVFARVIGEAPDYATVARVEESDWQITSKLRQIGLLPPLPDIRSVESYSMARADKLANEIEAGVPIARKPIPKAPLVKKRRKRYAIFQDHNGERQNIHLGRISSGDVKRAYRHIKALVDAKVYETTPCSEAVQWAMETELSITGALFRIGLLGAQTSRQELSR